MRAFAVVEEFEKAIAAFCGAPYCVATSTGTAAIFLALKFERERLHKEDPLFKTDYDFAPVVTCPARTFVSVPHAILHAGFRLKFVDLKWRDAGKYLLPPTNVIDSALLFGRNIYQPGRLQCLSFQLRKSLPIGEGGAVLTDSPEALQWLRRARYSGRDTATSFDVRQVFSPGWQLYMTPEKAARGLQLLEYWRQPFDYPDLRKAPYFARYA